MLPRCSHANVTSDKLAAAFLTASVAVDGDSPAAVFADRPVVFISARVHPGETPGSVWGSGNEGRREGACVGGRDSI